jgi:predicted nucleotidyltransferase
MTKVTKGVVRQASESNCDLSQEVSLHSTTITPEIINYIRQRIIEAIDPQQIVLFGSQALGKTSQGSDLDLLVVHDTGQTNRQIRRLLERLFLHRHFGLDLIVRTPEEVQLNLADSNPFYTDHIFGQGIILYERGESEKTR